jgi:hypothetical protein
VSAANRVLVLFECGRGGDAALELAAEVALARPTALTVVCVAPQGKSGSRCGNSALEYNQAVAESTAEDLDSARDRLGRLGVAASYELLIEGTDRSPAPFRVLAEFAVVGGFDLVLLPARRRPLRAASHPAAGALSRVAGAEVRVVDARQPYPDGQSRARAGAAG